MILCGFYVILFHLRANRSQKRSQPSDGQRPAPDTMRMAGGKEEIQPHLSACGLSSGTSWLVSSSRVKKRHFVFQEYS